MMPPARAAREALYLFVMVGKVHNDANQGSAVRKLDAYQAEILAADGQAYPGQLAMLTGLVATLNAVATHGDLADVRKLLAEYECDDAEARRAALGGAA